MQVMGPVRRFATHDVLCGHESELRRSLLIGMLLFTAFWFFHVSRWSPLWDAIMVLPLPFTAIEALASVLMATTAFAYLLLAGWFGFKPGLIAVRPFKLTDVGMGLLGGVTSLIFIALLPEINPFAPSFYGSEFDIPAEELEAISEENFHVFLHLQPSRFDELGTLVMIIFGLVVMAPLVEELVFRGWMQPALQTTWLGPGGAIAITALIFGFLHPDYAAAVASGVIFGGLRYFTGNLRSALIAHITHNVAVSVTMVFGDVIPIPG